jgi:glycosyltransferase involved in cell wall biosynthesis
MRVLIVYPNMQLYGGAELLVVKLANYLTRNRIENGVLTTDVSTEIREDLQGTRILQYAYPNQSGTSKVYNLFRKIQRLRQGIHENLDQYDVINVHNFPAEMTIFPRRKPVVWMCNEPPVIESKYYEQRKFSPKWWVTGAILALDNIIVRHHIRHVVVADEFNKRRFKTLYRFNPHVIPYGIDYHFFSSSDHHGERPSADRFTVLHVGVLTPWKNQLESLRTLERLKDRIPGIRLILAGTGEDAYIKKLSAYIEEKQLAPYVELTGHVKRSELRNLYAKSDVLLHPIRPQGGWLAPFEALCAKLPIVVSPELSASDLIKKADLGIVTKNYSTALLDICQNRAKYQQIAELRAMWVKEHLSWDAFGGEMVGVFATAMDLSRGSIRHSLRG